MPPTPIADVSREHHGHASVVLLLACLLLLRLAALWASGFDLFFDEAQYWAWSRALDVGYFSKPGMIAWLIAGSTAVCGNGPACVRLPAPLLDIATALAVYGLGARLYGARVGFWSALGFALMPATALSSLLITTDVPLLFFWTLGLIAAWALLERPGLLPALALGAAIAAGINAKYAMVYLPVTVLLHAALTPRHRGMLATPWPWLAIGIGLLGFLPNLVWNVRHDFVTFGHTGGNIGLAHAGLHPGKALEFLAGQFAIAGPVLPGAALVAAVPALRRGGAEADRFLLLQSLPIILVVAVNAVFGGMNINWAATAFPALVVLGTARLLRSDHRRWLALSLGIGVAASLAVGLGGVAVRFGEPPRFLAQARKMLHWQAFGDDLAAVARGTGVPTLVTVGRTLTAQGLYILRDSGLDIRAYRAAGAAPEDHFQMSRPWTPGDGLPVLLLTDGDPASLGLPGVTITPVADVPTQVHLARNGIIRLYRLDPAS